LLTIRPEKKKKKEEEEERIAVWNKTNRMWRNCWQRGVVS
jgi:hypothetical protein